RRAVVGDGGAKPAGLGLGLPVDSSPLQVAMGFLVMAVTPSRSSREDTLVQRAGQPAPARFSRQKAGLGQRERVLDPEPAVPLSGTESRNTVARLANPARFLAGATVAVVCSRSLNRDGTDCIRDPNRKRAGAPRARRARASHERRPGGPRAVDGDARRAV